MAELSPENFAKLLELLDPDPERAGEKYETLLLKLVKFVTWRGCSAADADALADETMNCMAQELGKGRVIVNPESYAVGVARNLLRKYHRRQPTRIEFNEAILLPDLPPQPERPDVMPCLLSCLEKLFPDPKDRQLLMSYYDNKGEKNKDHRKKLATAHGLSPVALRVRACRQRERLEKCITDCLQASG